MSTKLQKYLCAEKGGGSIVVANRTRAKGWETFRVGSSIHTFTFKSFISYTITIFCNHEQRSCGESMKRPSILEFLVSNLWDWQIRMKETV